MLCISTDVKQRTERGLHYRVTPGTLNGILASAEAALAARSDREACGLSVSQLAAFLLSIGHHEISLGRWSSPARSPMTLGRCDTTASNRPEGNKYQFWNDEPGTEPRRAFFHVGVGWWQIDDRSEWIGLNHAERAETGLGQNGRFDSSAWDSGGEAIAKFLAGKYCAGTSSANKSARVREAQAQKWWACGLASWLVYDKALEEWLKTPESERRPEDRPTFDNNCFDVSVDAMFVDYPAVNDDLHVTVSENLGQYSSSGGVVGFQCRWNNALANQDGLSDEFDCGFYDTERPEGGTVNADPLGLNDGRTKTPLAAPFFSFTYAVNGVEKRFAVFPGSILSAFSGGAQLDGLTRLKAVAQDTEVRDVAGAWHTTDFDNGTPGVDSDDVTLQVRVCRDSAWVLSSESHRFCEWLSANDSSFALRMGFATPLMPGEVL